MIAEIRQLNPKPGLAFGTTMVQPIVPDVFVRPGPDGAWLIELNSDTLPKVLVNQSYHAEVAKVAKSDKDKSYLADCLQTATWLIRALDQRAKTILKVSTEIVRQQDAFFAHGVQHLRPLNLKTIADAISMHESTVSRVTANKYMATNRGIFELKYFFTSAISSADGGEAHSAEAVRHRIRQLIDAENPDQVLSDDVIVDMLRAAGIDIARRTVAKYREAMRIPSSVQRRREKQIAHGRDDLKQRAIRGGGYLPAARIAIWCSCVIDHMSEGAALVRLTRSAGRSGCLIGGRSCRFGSRVRTSTSARRCATASTQRIAEATRKYFDGGFSGHVTVGRRATASAPSASSISIPESCSKPRRSRPTPMRAPTRRRCESRSGCAATSGG